MDLSDYRYTQSDYDSWSTNSNSCAIKRARRIIYIRTHFNSYEGIMKTLLMLSPILIHELNYAFDSINKIITQLSVIEINSIINCLKKCTNT